MIRSKQNRFVAVIEDDGGLREAIVNLLASEGIAARGFESAEQFLKSRTAPRAYCLLLDVQLPGMSGLELDDRLRARSEGRPTVLITAAEAAAARVRLGASRTAGTILLRKPFRDTDLLRAIRQALETHPGSASGTPSARTGRARRGRRSSQKPTQRS